MLFRSDSEISAQSMGIHLAWYKTLSFAISAGLTGLAGGLYAHKLRFLSPEQFTVLQSVEMLMMVFVGGIGSVHGAFFGAAFVIALPQFISVFAAKLPAAIGSATGLQATVFGLVLVANKVLGIDSCVQHIAAALRKPAVVCWVTNSPTVFSYDIHTNIKPAARMVDRCSIDAYIHQYDFAGGRQYDYPFETEDVFSITEIVETLL